ncbi:uncharacterized protein F4822DRAFT_363533 [Hypoxylon trugodes]|uniref:uncharacterized protein n=1 Tax=Hypoxylon trugodes TaxID=326681 RepID=UPI002193AB92|nr:uncharacterized protein F4822DRAFT_363533 [Hypoxylon trugodes]KAI1384429.1 hypothetical protein F4822DRAFT_363533 [Hypoxylon trugodes]
MDSDPSDNRGPEVRAFAIAAIVIIVVAIGLRFYSRSLHKLGENQSAGFWWDDWLVLISAIGAICESSLVFTIVKSGGDRHTSTLDPECYSNVLRLLYAMFFPFDFSLASAKASALLFMRRVFPPCATPTWFSVALWIAHVLDIVWYIGVNISRLLFCQPIEKFWNPPLPGHCGSVNNLFVSGVVAVSTGRTVITLTSESAIQQDFTYAVDILLRLLTEAPVAIVRVSIPAMLSSALHIGDTGVGRLVKPCQTLSKGGLLEPSGPRVVTT